MVNDGAHARLLQHDFAEPDAVRIASFAPGKVAAMLAVPAEQRAPEAAEILPGNGGVDPGPRKRRRFDGYPRTHGAIVP